MRSYRDLVFRKHHLHAVARCSLLLQMLQQRGLCVCVCLSVRWAHEHVSCTKTAELIEMPFEVQTRVGSRKFVVY